MFFMKKLKLKTLGEEGWKERYQKLKAQVVNVGTWILTEVNLNLDILEGLGHTIIERLDRILFEAALPILLTVLISGIDENLYEPRVANARAPERCQRDFSTPFVCALVIDPKSELARSKEDVEREEVAHRRAQAMACEDEVGCGVLFERSGQNFRHRGSQPGIETPEAFVNSSRWCLFCRRSWGWICSAPGVHILEDMPDVACPRERHHHFIVTMTATFSFSFSFPVS